jgi:hypothetical protein
MNLKRFILIHSTVLIALLCIGITWAEYTQAMSEAEMNINQSQKIFLVENKTGDYVIIPEGGKFEQDYGNRTTASWEDRPLRDYLTKKAWIEAKLRADKNPALNVAIERDKILKIDYDREISPGHIQSAYNGILVYENLQISGEILDVDAKAITYPECPGEYYNASWARISPPLA